MRSPTELKRDATLPSLLLELRPTVPGFAHSLGVGRRLARLMGWGSGEQGRSHSEVVVVTDGGAAGVGVRGLTSCFACGDGTGAHRPGSLRPAMIPPTDAQNSCDGHIVESVSIVVQFWCCVEISKLEEPKQNKKEPKRTKATCAERSSHLCWTSGFKRRLLNKILLLMPACNQMMVSLRYSIVLCPK